MRLHSLSRLAFSSEHGWPELRQRPPALRNLFMRVVLPLSLLPPVMVYLAGTRRPWMLPGGAGVHDWLRVAEIFFLAEMVTIAALGWLIREVAATRRVALDARAAWLLALVCPIPLWLSSLALLAGSPAFGAAAALGALVLSGALMLRGVGGLGRARDTVVAAGIAHTVLGACVSGWVLLLALVLL